MSFVQICMKSDAVVVILLQVGYHTNLNENHLTPQGQQEKGISDGVRFLHRSFGYALKNLPCIYTFFLLLGYEIIYASLLILGSRRALSRRTSFSLKLFEATSSDFKVLP